MKKILEKLGINNELEESAIAEILEIEKQKALRRYNNVFGNPIKEMELSLRIKMIEDAQQEIAQKSSATNTSHIGTGLMMFKDTFNINEVSFIPKVSTPQNESDKENLEAYNFFVKGSEAYQNQDKNNAFDFFQKAAKMGHTTSMFLIGMMYEIGYIEENYSEALKWFQKAAEVGHAESMYYLGCYYRDGKGLEQNNELALTWFQKAAANGSADAMFELACIYREGKGVPQSDSEAFRWCQKAIQNDPTDQVEAMFSLGYFYENGQGVEQDYSEAFEWYQRAAEAGSAEASLNIAFMYKNGEGMPASMKDALEWYHKAAEQGSALAQYDLGCLYELGVEVEKDTVTSAKWYQKAAEQGIPEAQFSLGFCYSNGYGVTKNPFKAVKWYQKAAEQNITEAQYNLGVCYEAGMGVTKDYSKAVQWYQRAATNGYAPAQEWLKNEHIEQEHKNISVQYKYSKDEHGDIQWSGDFDDCMTGYGKKRYISGEFKGQWYEGNFIDGLFHGQGIYHIGETTISGIFEHGFNGKLRCQYNDRTIYDGEYQYGKKNGNGILYNEDGTGFQGEFKDDEAWNGQGAIIYTHSDGVKVKVIGKFVNGSIQGIGKTFHLNGSMTKYWYEGTFVNGQYGEGTLYMPDGGKIAGNFANGTIKIIDEKGQLLYEGGYKNSTFHGKGTLYENDGSRLCGEWNNGNFIRGQGSRTTNINGILVKEVGMFEKGNLQGVGKRFVLSGDDRGGYWEGNFINGNLNGFCVFHNNQGGRTEVQMVDGIYHGIVKVYSNVGMLCYETIYKNGKEVGPRKESYLYKKSRR